MKPNHLIILIILSVEMFACKSNASLPTVDKLDVTRYAGTWYEIERLPNRFEKGLQCVTATYTVRPDGRITVLNKGFQTDNPSKVSDIKGTAWVPDPEYPGRLKVRFFWPFAGDYYVIALDDKYAHALVGDPSRKFLWILARHPQPDASIVSELKSIATEQGFDTNKMIFVNQDCHD
jgi:lipocalin